ncbi:Conserved hypothetical protein [Micromonospora lupini str. Lupac 08]|uniref:Outer membrane channel protein CpnT-like N-terminal domain-containing protein n=1 Tax=Micromonospora lupini str. Lupac 08 TaxID=1150864 RepID=I0KW02_9ACTN|nr:Conserved hypothetical protein [Micromonospora lupini str. Lupac 08]
MSTDVANPLIAARQDTTTAYSGVGLVESLVDLRHGIESGSWVDSTIGGFGTSMEVLATCVDPIGSVVSWGVAWLIEHVKPLSDALDWLAGDPDQITAYAQTWHNVSRHVTGQVTALSEAVRTEIATWTGPASEAYRRYSDEHLRHLAGLADASGLLGTVVEGAGLLVALVRELVRDLIADFVSVLAVRLWEWLAEAGLTLGLATPLVAAQVSTLVAKWAAKITGLLTALARSVSRLRPILSRLGDLLDTLRTALRGLRRTPGGSSPSDMPAPGPGARGYTDPAGGGQPPPWARQDDWPPDVDRAPGSPGGGPAHGGPPGAPPTAGGPGHAGGPAAQRVRTRRRIRTRQRARPRRRSGARRRRPAGHRRTRHSRARVHHRSAGARSCERGRVAAARQGGAQHDRTRPRRTRQRRVRRDVHRRHARRVQAERAGERVRPGPLHHPGEPAGRPGGRRLAPGRGSGLRPGAHDGTVGRSARGRVDAGVRGEREPGSSRRRLPRRGGRADGGARLRQRQHRPAHG